MKTLKTIQVLSKIGKILSKIVFIFSIIGFCGCAAGIISLAVGAETLKIGDVTIEGLIMNNSGYSIGTMYASMSAIMILCAGKAILAKFAECYFKSELADGTPFNLESINKLLRLGVLTICVPIGAQILAKITYAVLSNMLSDAAPLNLSGYGSVMLGVMFIVTAVICKYGAEVCEEQKGGQ